MYIYIIHNYDQMVSNENMIAIQNLSFSDSQLCLFVAQCSNSFEQSPPHVNTDLMILTDLLLVFFYIKHSQMANRIKMVPKRNTNLSDFSIED